MESSIGFFPYSTKIRQFKIPPIALFEQITKYSIRQIFNSPTIQFANYSIRQIFNSPIIPLIWYVIICELQLYSRPVVGKYFSFAKTFLTS